MSAFTYRTSCLSISPGYKCEDAHAFPTKICKNRKVALSVSVKFTTYLNRLVRSVLRTCSVLCGGYHMFNPPTVEDLQETRRANEKLVLAALDSKPEWVETELAKTTGLALSHLRAALASLLDQGRVRRLPGTGTRAVYGLADPGLADVPASPLSPLAKKVRFYLEGRADSALHMAEELRSTREEIMASLSLLNAHNMITCTFVGSLVIFRLKEAQALLDQKDSKPEAKKKQVA
jgi:GntR family transcriptional repressor for pyruvate dehydrogenase complex